MYSSTLNKDQYEPRIPEITRKACCFSSYPVGRVSLALSHTCWVTAVDSYVDCEVHAHMCQELSCALLFDFFVVVVVGDEPAIAGFAVYAFYPVCLSTTTACIAMLLSSTSKPL